MYLVFLLLLAFSAFFSASETALSSANRIRLKNRADDGDKRARRVLRLEDDFDGTLSAILVGNNVVNIGSASLATILATAILGAWAARSGLRPLRRMSAIAASVSANSLNARLPQAQMPAEDADDDGRADRYAQGADRGQ